MVRQADVRIAQLAIDLKDLEEDIYQILHENQYWSYSARELILGFINRDLDGDRVPGYYKYDIDKMIKRTLIYALHPYHLRIEHIQRATVPTGDDGLPIYYLEVLDYGELDDKKTF